MVPSSNPIGGNFYAAGHFLLSHREEFNVNLV